MDTTTPPRDEDDPTAVQPTAPPPLIEPTPPPGSRAAGSTAVGSNTSAPDPVDEAEDPSAPDAPVETTITAEPAGSRPDSEPVAPTAEPESVQPAQPPAPQTQAAQYPDPVREIVYVAAPTPPRKKGNRGFGVLLALLSTVLFLLFYALFALLIRTVTLGDSSIDFLRDGSFYIPTVLFAIGFVLLALLVNRAGWWSFVLGSLLVGIFVFLGTIVALLATKATELTPAEAQFQFRVLLTSPLTIAAGLVAREVALWVGAAISTRGRRVTVKNAEARADFDREQEARRAEFERTGGVASPA
jgi:hypothetical protein